MQAAYIWTISEHNLNVVSRLFSKMYFAEKKKNKKQHKNKNKNKKLVCNSITQTAEQKL